MYSIGVGMNPDLTLTLILALYWPYALCAWPSWWLHLSYA